MLAEKPTEYQIVTLAGKTLSPLHCEQSLSRTQHIAAEIAVAIPRIPREFGQNERSGTPKVRANEAQLRTAKIRSSRLLEQL